MIEPFFFLSLFRPVPSKENGSGGDKYGTKEYFTFLA